MVSKQINKDKPYKNAFNNKMVKQWEKKSITNLYTYIYICMYVYKKQNCKVIKAYAFITLQFWKTFWGAAPLLCPWQFLATWPLWPHCQQTTPVK